MAQHNLRDRNTIPEIFPWQVLQRPGSDFTAAFWDPTRSRASLRLAGHVTDRWTVPSFYLRAIIANLRVIGAGECWYRYAVSCLSPPKRAGLTET